MREIIIRRAAQAVYLASREPRSLQRRPHERQAIFASVARTAAAIFTRLAFLSASFRPTSYAALDGPYRQSRDTGGCAHTGGLLLTLLRLEWHNRESFFCALHLVRNLVALTRAPGAEVGDRRKIAGRGAVEIRHPAC